MEFDHGSNSGNADGGQQRLWNMLNPVENRLPEYLPSSSDANITYANAVSREVRSLSGWHSGESSSSENTRRQITRDEAKTEHGWSSSLHSIGGVAPGLEERRYEPTNSLSLDSINISLSSNQAANGTSRSRRIPRNFNLNSVYSGNSVSGDQVMESDLSSHHYKPDGSETNYVPSAGGSGDPYGTASGSGGNLTGESDGRPGSSFDGRRLSCKRKATEGVSGQMPIDGSTSGFQPAENSVWHASPAHYNAANSSSISTPAETSITVNHVVQLNPQYGVGVRGPPSNSHPALSILGFPASSQRNSRMRISPTHQQDSTRLNLSLTGNAIRRVRSPVQSSLRFPPSDHSLNLRPPARHESSHIQSNLNRNPGLQRTVDPLPRNGASSSRGGDSSSVILGDRTSVLQGEIHTRNITRLPAFPMLYPAVELMHMAEDPSNWNLPNANVSFSGSLASNFRVGSSSGVHLSSAPTLVPQHNAPSMYPQRLAEIHRTLMLVTDSESEGHSGNIPPFVHSGPSLSQDMSHQGHHQPYPRPALMTDIQADNIPATPVSFRALAAGSEGRTRLLSELRNVLTILRGASDVNLEALIGMNHSLLMGVLSAAELHDRHREMRLDVDNMSYEELLELEERIGSVNTGLNEETILKYLKQQKYLSFKVGVPSEVEPCCICQEEYVEGEDIGMLDCGHDFHTGCIKQWLLEKNLCPVCKTTALDI